MNNDFLIGQAQLNQAHESRDSSDGGFTRRSFIKRTGGATVATLVAFNLLSDESKGEDSQTSAEASFRYLIKCVAWPNPEHDRSRNQINSCDYYVTNLSLSGAYEGAKSESFTIGISASGIHTWKPVFGTSMRREGVQEKMSIRLWLEEQKIKVTHLYGDGKDKNGDMEIVVAVTPLVTAKAYLMKSGWSLTNGSIGWNGDDLTADLEFSSGSEEIDSVGLGSAFTVVKVDRNGNEI